MATVPLLSMLLALAIGAAIGFAVLWRRALGRSVELTGALEPAETADNTARLVSTYKTAAILVGANGSLVAASPPAYMLGLIRDNQISLPGVREMVFRARHDQTLSEAELELPRKTSGGNNTTLLVRVARINRGQVIVIAEDLTEANRIEAIRRDFVVNVSHELKSPVGAIALLAETVSDAADDPVAVRRFSDQMATEARRLSQLVQSIIELSRVQGTSVLSNSQAVSVAAVIAEAVSRVETAAEAKHISIRVATNAEQLVYGDESLLITALRNLLDNAIAYSPPYSSVGVGVTEADGMVNISVIDRGIGIDKEDMPRIFERFYRTDPARSRVTGGTGLGLAIVKHIAKEHGGDIRVWSTPNSGSTFTLSIPAAREEWTH